MTVADHVLALDVAKRTGAAEGVPGGTPILTSHSFYRQGDDDADVFARTARWLSRRLISEPPLAAVAVERPLPVFDSTMLYGQRGVVLALVRCKNIPLLQVPVATWRTYFLGVGNLKGNVAKARCVTLCGDLGWDVPSPRPGALPDHNAAEAGGIWLWACAQVDPINTQRHEPLFIHRRN